MGCWRFSSYDEHGAIRMQQLESATNQVGLNEWQDGACAQACVRVRVWKSSGRWCVKWMLPLLLRSAAEAITLQAKWMWLDQTVYRCRFHTVYQLSEYPLRRNWTYIRSFLNGYLRMGFIVIVVINRTNIGIISSGVSSSATSVCSPALGVDFVEAVTSANEMLSPRSADHSLMVLHCKSSLFNFRERHPGKALLRSFSITAPKLCRRERLNCE
jgi:hypothetical protein